MKILLINELNGYVIPIGSNSDHTEKTHLWFPKCLWFFDTEWNAHQIRILDNLFD